MSNFSGKLSKIFRGRKSTEPEPESELENMSRLVNNSFFHEKVSVKQNPKNNLSKLELENISKLINNSFFHEKVSVKQNPKNNLDAFFKDIKHSPDAVEYILENIPPLYTDAQFKNAKNVSEYLESDPKLDKIYSKRKQSLKNEFDKQLGQLKLSKFAEFWNKLGQKIKSENNIDIDFGKINQAISYVPSDLQRVSERLYFHTSDCCSALILKFKESYATVVSDNMYRVWFEEGVDSQKIEDDILGQVRIPVEKALSKTIAEKSGNDLGDAVTEYVKENKISLPKVIKKLNQILVKLGSLKLKNIKI